MPTESYSVGSGGQEQFKKTAQALSSSCRLLLSKYIVSNALLLKNAA